MQEIQYFDPSAMKFEQGASGVFKAKDSKENGTLTLVVTKFGNLTEDLKFQLFGAITGIHQAKNSGDFPNFNPIKGDTASGFLLDAIKAQTAASADFAAYKLLIANALSTVYNESLYTKRVAFNENGDLVIYATRSSGVIISCQEMSYQQLLKTLEVSTMIVSNIQMNYNEQVQLNRKLDFRRISMLGGKSNNDLTPQRYFKKEQNQSGIVDITEIFAVDSSLEINTTFFEDETEISYILSVSGYSNNAWQNRA